MLLVLNLLSHGYNTIWCFFTVNPDICIVCNKEIMHKHSVYFVTDERIALCRKCETGVRLLLSKIGITMKYINREDKDGKVVIHSLNL